MAVHEWGGGVLAVVTALVYVAVPPIGGAGMIPTSIELGAWLRGVA